MTSTTKCGGCQKTLKGDAVACSVCDLWYDLKCADVDASTFSFLNSPSGKKGSIHWNCASCESSSKKLMDMIAKTNNKVDQLTLVVAGLDTKVEGKLENLNKGLKDVVVSFHEQLDKAVAFLNEKLETVARSPSHTGSESRPNDLDGASTIAPNVVSALTNELRERDKRARNAVFTGNATETTIKLIAQKAEVEAPLEIVTVGKPGKKFFIVTFKSESQKWRTVSRARGICMASDELKGIYVNPDLTKTERDHQYQLRKEVRERRARGENVMIKKGAVVVKNE